jgi:hypothetical protein
VRNLWIQIIRDSDSATLDVTYDAANKAAALTWSAGTSSYISKRYSQVNGATDITISSSSDQELVITGGAWITNTSKYCLFEPSKSTLSVMDIPLSVNGRMKNKALAAYIILKDDKSAVTGYTSDYVFPIKCSAGLQDFGWTNLSNIYWYNRDGTTSTASRPGVTFAGAGTDYSFGTNMQANNIVLKGNSTGVRWIGDVVDLPALTYHLDIRSCTLLTGNVANLPRVTYILSVRTNSLLVGDVANLPRVTSYLDIRGVVLLTGTLNSLPKLIDYLDMGLCELLTGPYTPTTNTTTPTTFNIAYATRVTPESIDATLIACDQAAYVKNGVTFTWTALSRTSASDAAKLDLKTNHSWTFVPDT